MLEHWACDKGFWATPSILIHWRFQLLIGNVAILGGIPPYFPSWLRLAYTGQVLLRIRREGRYYLVSRRSP